MVVVVVVVVVEEEAAMMVCWGPPGALLEQVRLSAVWKKKYIYIYEKRIRATVWFEDVFTNLRHASR